VFGPERGGLLATDLFACDARISLPSSPSFPTLNLSQAVAATLALCRVKREARTPRSQDTAPSRDLALLLERLHSVLAKASYPGAGHSRAVLSEIDSFIRRGHPTVREVRLWLGALSALERKLEGQEKAGD
jgi:tRNA C32,U32 (ribose-2'-O)-methylase TrmJ